MYELEGCCRAHFLARRGWMTTCVEPRDPEDSGQQPLFPLLHLLLLMLTLQRTFRISFGVHFQFNKKNYLLGKFTKPAITMLFCNDPLQNRRNYFWKTLFESKAEPSHFRNSNGLGLGVTAESTLMSGCPSAHLMHQVWRANRQTHRPGGAFPISGFVSTVPICFLS